MLSYLACRTAIKSGDKLTKEQMKDLINKLAETKTQYTCPHGRPVKIDISMRELERMFKRSGF
jgi:DNA mismatch repair protein MutL